jgi:hypothetical protein
LSPDGAHLPASIIFSSNSSEIGSGLYRLMLLLYFTISKRSSIKISLSVQFFILCRASPLASFAHQYYSSSISIASCSHTATQTSHPSHSACRTAWGCPSFDSSTSFGQDSTQVEHPVHFDSSTTNRYLHSDIFFSTHLSPFSSSPPAGPIG